MSLAVTSNPLLSKGEAGRRGTAHCRTVDDAYGLESRRLIGRILAPYLDETRLTPIELLHGYEYGLALTNSGNRLSGYVQLVAIAQVPATGQSVGDRVRELFIYTDAILLTARKLKLDFNDVVLSTQQLNELCGDGRDLKPAFAALTNFLKDATGWTDKIERLLALGDGRLTSVTLGVFDDLLSEILARPAVLDDLYGATEAREARIVRLLAMAGRTAPSTPSGATEPTRQKLVRFLGTLDLPLCCAVLMAQVKRVMDLPGIFASRSPTEELAALQRMLKVFSKVDPAIGRADIIASIEARVGRLITPDMMGKLVPEAAPQFRKIALVLDLYDEVPGEVARTALIKFLTLLFDEGSLTRAMQHSKQTPAESAQELDSLMGRIHTGALPQPTRQLLVERLLICIAKLHAASIDKRGNSRAPSGVGDYVIVQNERVDLVNWSTVGILFGPVMGKYMVNQNLRLALRVHTYKGPVQFDADIQVVRVQNGQVAARYFCVRNPDDQIVKAHFAFLAKTRKS